MEIAILSNLTHWPRLLFSIAAGIVVYFLTAAIPQQSIRGLLGWDTMAVLYTFIAVVTLNSQRGLHRLREKAAQEDENGWVILLLLCVAAVTSLAAIATLFINTKSLPPDQLHVHLALAALTIIGSWSFIHTLFAFHYAHEYFGDSDARPDRFEMRGGLEFPKTEEPIFSDFLYFSYIIGMTCQVSDVQVSKSGMRRLALLHGILAFFFNTIILALSVNFAASIIS